MFKPVDRGSDGGKDNGRIVLLKKMDEGERRK